MMILKKKFFLLQSATIILVAILTRFSTEAQEDIKECYDQLFGFPSKRLSSDETFDYLKRYHDLTRYNILKVKASVLIQMRKLDGCTVAEMYNINRLCDEYQFDLNIVNYIWDFRRKYLEKCEGKYDDPIEKDFKALSDKTRESISLMEVKIIDEASNGVLDEKSPFISRKSVIKGLTDYLATRNCQVCQLISNPSQVKKLKRSNFDSAYNEFIRSSCKEFIDGMDTIEKVFRYSRNIYVAKAAGKQKRKLAAFDFCYMATDGGMPDEVYKSIKTNPEASPNKKRSLLDKLRLNKSS